MFSSPPSDRGASLNSDSASACWPAAVPMSAIALLLGGYGHPWRGDDLAVDVLGVALGCRRQGAVTRPDAAERGAQRAAVEPQAALVLDGRPVRHQPALLGQP